jgi:hypothetical protein
MTILEQSICDMLGAASSPLKLSQLLISVHTNIETCPFSFDDFTTALCNLQSQDKIVEDSEGYHVRTESEITLASLGL